jgi:anti-sigma factor RsiW
MAHDDAVVTAYLWGDLDPEASERFERHLVDCDQCWSAVVEDGQGRSAAESLRELAPPVLRDRIRFAMDGEKGPAGRKPAGRFRPAAAVLLVILAAGATVAGLLGVRGHSRPSDPASVAEVVRLAGAGRAPAAPLSVDGQALSVSRLDEVGSPVLVARSEQPFPMAVGAIPMWRDDRPWFTTRRGLTVVCVNRPHPVLLVARLPANQLIALAGHLAR